MELPHFWCKFSETGTKMDLPRKWLGLGYTIEMAIKIINLKLRKKCNFCYVNKLETRNIKSQQGK